MSMKKQLSQTGLSSPDVVSLADSVACSEDRLDSDLEADLQQVVGLMKDVQTIDNEHFSVTSSDVFLSGPNGGAEFRSRISSTTNTIETKTKPSTFFRKAVLSGVSSQLKNASSKVDVGKPSCLSFRKYLIIGTSKGIIFGFNLQQVLRFCLGSIDSASGATETLAGQGPVSVLSQSLDGTKLLAGYQSGRIAVWRLTPPPPASTSSPQHESHMIRGQLSVTDENADSVIATATEGLTPPEHAVTHHADFNPSSHTSLKLAAPRSVQHTRSGAKIRLMGRSNSDTAVGQLLYVIDDAHGVGQAIAFASFTTLSSVAVSVDTGGSVFALNLKRGLTGSRKDSICFFSGSRGEICALDTLGSTALLSDLSSDESRPTSPDRNQESGQHAGNSLGSYALVAMASFTKLIVAQLRPRVQIAYWHPLTGPSACLPLVTWQWDLRTSTGSNERALLAFGRGSTFRLLQVTWTNVSPGFDGTKSEESKASLRFDVLHTFDLTYELTCLNWISSTQVAALDVTETLHLLDSMTGEDAETIDLCSVQLCYNSYLFQSSADGGSVSEALAYAGQRACSQSVTTHGSQLLILGQSGVHLVALRKWTDIVHSLLSHGMLDTALIYCLRALESARLNKQDVALRGSITTLELSCKQIPAIPDPNMSWGQLHSVVLTLLREQLTPLLASDIPHCKNNSDGNGSESGGHSNSLNSSEVSKPITPLVVALAVRIACLLDNYDFFITDLYENLRRDPQTRSWLFISIYETMLHRLPRFGQLCSDKLGTRTVPHQDCIALSHSLPPNLVMDWIAWCLTPEYDVDRASWPGCLADDATAVRMDSGDGRAWAEQAILCLPPNCLDLNDAVHLCWRHHLFKAYLHLYTDVLLDFETPFRELVDQMVQGSQLQRSSLTGVVDGTNTELDDLVEPYGQTLLLLLRHALAGESYSQQPLPSPMDVDVPTYIFNLLLNEALPQKIPGRDLRSQPQPKYPRLWLLLSHNATDFLNLLTLSIGSDRFFSSGSGELGISHCNHLYHKLMACAMEELCTDVGSQGSGTVGYLIQFSPTKQFSISVFGFLAHQFTSTSDVPVQLNSSKMFQLFENICLQLEKSKSLAPVTFETCVIELLETERFTHLDACLELARRAKLFSLIEHIHRKLGRRVDAFEAQLNRLDHLMNISHDRLRVELGNENRAVDSELEQLAAMVYAFLDQVFSYACVHSAHVCGLSSAEVEQTQSLVLMNIELLVTCDAERILRLLYNMFRLPLPELLAKISSAFAKSNAASDAESQVDSETCTLILRAYYRARQLQLDMQNAHAESNNMWSTHGRKASISSDVPTNLSDWGRFLTRSHPEVADYFVRLLARDTADKGQLFRFLETNSDYRIDCALTFLSPTEYPRECAYLHEKRGQFEEASSIYEQMFVTRWHTLVQAASNECDKPPTAVPCVEKPIELARAEARAAADLWFAFIQRRSAVLSDGDDSVNVEQIWFHAINVLLREEHTAKSHALESDINDLFHSLLSYLPGSISLTTIVSYILQSATSQTTSRFNPQTSNLLTRLVATCHLEVEQMTLNCELAKRELTKKQSTLLARLRQGFAGGLWCDMCQGSLRSASRIESKHSYEQTASVKAKVSSSVIFRCQHIFHTQCLLLVGAKRTDKEGSASLDRIRHQWICPVCVPCPISSGLTTAPPGIIESQSSMPKSINGNEQMDTEEVYLSWYDPIRLDLQKHSINPFD